MNDWLKAMNPSSPIATESEALRAARASAISIFIGVVVGAISVLWSYANPQVLHDAVTQGAGQISEAQLAAAAQLALYTGGFLVVVQLILGAIQWRAPKKFLAILFIVLVAYGIVSSLAAPVLAGMMPNVPQVPIWQVALSVVILILQMVLHVAGLRGIKKLDDIQMEQAR
jgi:uncharacterized membrane protein